MEVFVDRDGIYGWFRNSLTRIDPDRIGVSFRNVTAQKLAEQQLKASEAEARERLQELEAIYEAAPVGLAFMDPQLRFVRINRQLAEINGLPPSDHIGRTIQDVVPAIVPQVDEVVRRVLDGESTVVAEISGETAAHPGVVRHWLAHWATLRNAEGVLRGLNVVVEDVTDQKQAADQRKLLADELAHRMKNTLAMVQSIGRQTFRGLSEPDRLREFEQRLQALGAAHSLLTQKGWRSASLADVIRAALGAHVTGQVVLQGPDVDLPSSACMGVALAIHELATNAAKYGALSTEAGVVQIRWRMDAVGVLTLHWEEEGGPTVAPPTRRGFGSRLLRQVFTPSGGDVELIFLPSGVSARMCVPLPPAAATPAQA
jgi:two-component system CheB/CheR fusion protein